MAISRAQLLKELLPGLNALFGDFGAGLGILGRSPLEPADGQQQGKREGG